MGSGRWAESDVDGRRCGCVWCCPIDFQMDDALDFMKGEYRTRMESCELRQREFEKRAPEFADLQKREAMAKQEHLEARMGLRRHIIMGLPGVPLRPYGAP